MTAAAEMLWQGRCWPGVFSGRKKGWFCAAGLRWAVRACPTDMVCGTPVKSISIIPDWVLLQISALSSNISLWRQQLQPLLLLCAVLTPSVRSRSSENIWAHLCAQPPSPWGHSQWARAAFPAVTHQSKLEISFL